MNSHSSRLHGHDRAFREVAVITGERLDRRRALLFGAKRHQTKYSTVRLAADDDDLPKVLVESDENLTVPMRVRQDLSITWILRKASGEACYPSRSIPGQSALS
jgi:hypothetical protein